MARLVQTSFRPVLLASAILVTGVGTSAQGGDFLGTFRGAGKTVVFQKAAVGLRGFLTAGKNVLPLTARFTRTGIAGSYETVLGPMPFQARLVGDVLHWKVGAGESKLSRVVARPVVPRRVSRFPKLSRLGPPRPDPRREWTVVAYVAADNDLEATLLQDLREMHAGVPANTDVVVLIDRSVGYAVTPNSDWTDARVFHVSRQESGKPAAITQLAAPGELDMGDPEVLAAFVEGAFTAFPARRRAVILGNHGGGWANQCIDHKVVGPDGKLIDRTSYLTLVEVGAGLRRGLRRAGVARLDILGFDQCLMAQLETAVEMQDLARFLIASQALEPGRGWPYDAWLPHLEKGRSTRQIAVAAVTEFDAFYRARTNGTTLSVVDLSRVGALVRSLDALLAKCAPLLSTRWPAFARAVYYAETYTGRMDFLRNENATASNDLGDILLRVRAALTPFPAEREFQAFASAMRDAVVNRRNGFARRLSNGLSVYAPPTAGQLSAEYAATRLAKRHGWARFLHSLHRAIAADRSALRIQDARVLSSFGKPPGVVSPIHGDKLTATLVGKNVIWTRIQECRVLTKDDVIIDREGFVADAEWVTRLGEAVPEASDLMMPRYQDGTTQLLTRLQPIPFEITDGKSTGTGTIIYDEPGPHAAIRVPVRYAFPNGKRFKSASLTFDPVSWKVQGLTIFLELPGGRRVPRGVGMDAGGFVTLIHKVRSFGRASSLETATLRWGKDVRLRVGLAAPGPRLAILTAETMSGRRAVAEVPFRVVPGPDVAIFRNSFRGYRPGQLAGRWQQYYLLRGRPEPMHVELTLRADPKQARRYTAEAVFHKNGGMRQQQTFEFDERWNLRVVVPGVAGGRPNVYYGPAWLTRAGELEVKLLNFSGVIWRFRRPGK